jgi:septum formation protein
MLILASTSPFRKELLERLGLEFQTAAPEVDEAALPGETPEHLVARLAEAKAKAVQKKFSDGLIIGSDQVAVLDNRIITKPGGHDNAVQQLMHASGRKVTFLTGLCLFNARTDRAQVQVIPYSVVFRNLQREQVETYLHREQPYNCAGSFKSEGLGIALFQRMEGDDPTSLIGLPLITLIDMLANEGVGVLR